MSRGERRPAWDAYPVMVAVGWVTVGLAALLLAGGLLIGNGALLPGSDGAAQLAMFLARIAPWPVLLPLGVVELVIARRAAAERGWLRAAAIGIAVVFIAFALLGAGAVAGSGGWFVLVAKLAWVGANGYVIAALLSGRQPRAA